MILQEDVPYHKSYGYATKEQVEELYLLKSGSRYKMLLKQIEFQNKHKGIVKGKFFNG